jgi:hypothetical protein
VAFVSGYSAAANALYQSVMGDDYDICAPWVRHMCAMGTAMVDRGIAKLGRSKRQCVREALQRREQLLDQLEHFYE